MTDQGVEAIDADLRALLAGDETRAIAALVSRGQPALDRLLDAIARRIDVPSKVGQREKEEALMGALTAFAKQDLDAVLKGVEARGLQDGFSALWALGCVVDPRVVPLLLRNAASKDAITRWMAVSGLARQRDPRATEALIHALGDRASDVRDVAAQALGEIGDPRAIEPLEAALSSGYARRSAAFARYVGTALDKLRASGAARG
jgi:HEAT repeat protein